jgi:hypothetical protein
MAIVVLAGPGEMVARPVEMIPVPVWTVAIPWAIAAPALATDARAGREAARGLEFVRGPRR